MSKIVLYPANGFDFDAADVAAYLAGLTSGVFSGDEDFPVTATGGLKVTVGAGRGWVHPSRFTGYSITKREADTLTMPLADPSLPRIDRIVMRYDAGARAASLQVLQGTASSTPTAPAISRTELIYDLCLAETKNVFVTVDLDCLDTSIMPGTGTPEVGGMSFNELVGWFKYLKDFNIVGADVVELAPDYDASGASTAVATKVIRELLMAM